MLLFKKDCNNKKPEKFKSIKLGCSKDEFSIQIDKKNCLSKKKFYDI